MSTLMLKAKARRRRAEAEQSPMEARHDQFTAENIAGSAVEPLLTLASGAAALPVSGIGGLLSSAFGGDAEETIKSVQEAMTYSPKTEGGKVATDFITKPFQWIHEGARATGNDMLEAGYSPGAATVVDTMIQALPMIAGAKYAPKGKPHFPKVEAALKAPVTYPAKLAGKGVGVVKDAIVNRLPGGTEKTLGSVVNEMTGPRQTAVVEALMNAEKGETAGQAAVGAGSTEFSALQKLAESTKPSETYAINEAQQAARVKTLREDFGKTPEELALAEKAIKENATENYGKVQSDLVDPRTRSQVLEEAAQKAKTKADMATVSKVSAVQDVGKMQSLEANQRVRGENYSSPSGEVKVPKRYAPQTQIAAQAKEAVGEMQAIAKQRLIQEQTHTSISESMLLNTRGETGVPLSKYLTRPSIQKAIEAARDSALEKGSYFPKAGENFSVANLQRIKRAVADNLRVKKGEGTLGATEQAEIAGTLDSFNGWLKDKSSGFKAAEEAFAAEKAPINQMKIGQALIEALESRLGPQEGVTKFANAEANAAKLVKDATGGTRPIVDILTEQQMAKKAQVRGELERDATLDFQARKGNKAMNKSLGTMFDMPKLRILDRGIVIFNTILKKIEGKNTEATINLMSDIMLNKPKEMARIMKAATPKEAGVLKEAQNQLITLSAIGAAENNDAL